ncbi:pyruvate carboxylase [Hortaea werneckii]|nr:pyruvate carboxylase [Hortaea werneckii]KAI7320249.1 pyruvate carboxylase [Hortaea werneckii]
MSSINPRPIKRLLVANRGEIAARILSSARELDLETYAVYTDNDIGHIYNAAHAIRLQSPASYLNISELVDLVKQYGIDAVHPGYGFLSESAEFAQQMADVNVMVVGPGARNLSRTGDKLQARLLAVECNVPVLPALTEPTGNVDAVKLFAEKNGLPIMVKAVDGGGGRGIRLIRRMDDLQSSVTRAVEESPSKQVFAEKAAVDGYRHVEVQIIGDGTGAVRHLWERECSIQRRYQKIVELAPSTAPDRRVVAPVIEAAVRMAEKVQYASLGTFEFLLNPSSSEFFFLEINPRLQVEHTITESICSIDIVKAQLELAQGASMAEAGLNDLSSDPMQPPKMHSIQLRITAEDPEKNYSLSIGKIQSFHFPSGQGIRVDTALHSDTQAVVSSDFDSVIAKLIVTAKSWPQVVKKAQRAVEDVAVVGINTNITLLRAIMQHEDFQAGACDTQWLETKHQELLDASRKLSTERQNPFHGVASAQTSGSQTSSVSSAAPLFRKDDAWAVTLRPLESKATDQQPHHLQLTRVLRNDFPSTFAADILFTRPGAQPEPYSLDVQATSSSAGATSSQHRQGSRSDPTHVILPISGKLVEVLVDAGDVVKKDEAICVVKQMKMEIEIRSHKAGMVTWVTEAEDDEDVAEGMLAAIVEDEKAQAKL